jgi:hypothetical protein
VARKCVGYSLDRKGKGIANGLEGKEEAELEG